MGKQPLRPRMELTALTRGLLESPPERKAVMKALLYFWGERRSPHADPVLPADIADHLFMEEERVLRFLRELEIRGKVFIKKQSKQIVGLYDPNKLPPEDANQERLKMIIGELRKQCDDLEAESDQNAERFQTERNKRQKAEEQLKELQLQLERAQADLRLRDTTIKELQATKEAGGDAARSLVPSEIISAWNQMLNE